MLSSNISKNPVNHSLKSLSLYLTFLHNSWFTKFYIYWKPIPVKTYYYYVGFLVSFTRFFQENIKNLKSMCRGIKKIISSSNSNHIFPTAITVNNETITHPSEMTNAFNNCFPKVGVDMQSSIISSMKKYYDYLPPLK